jgi:hypothetical protein
MLAGTRFVDGGLSLNGVSFVLVCVVCLCMREKQPGTVVSVFRCVLHRPRHLCCLTCCYPTLCFPTHCVVIRLPPLHRALASCEPVSLSLFRALGAPAGLALYSHAVVSVRLLSTLHGHRQPKNMQQSCQVARFVEPYWSSTASEQRAVCVLAVVRWLNCVCAQQWLWQMAALFTP